MPDTKAIIFDRGLVETNGKEFSSEAERQYYEARFPVAKQILIQISPKTIESFDSWDLARKMRLVDLCVELREFIE